MELITSYNNNNNNNNYDQIQIDNQSQNSNLNINDLCYVEIYNNNDDGTYNYSKELCLITNINLNNGYYTIKYRPINKIIKNNNLIAITSTIDSEITVNSDFYENHSEFGVHYCGKITKTSYNDSIKFKRITVDHDRYLENEYGSYYNNETLPIANVELPDWCSIDHMN